MEYQALPHYSEKYMVCACVQKLSGHAGQQPTLAPDGTQEGSEEVHFINTGNSQKQETLSMFMAVPKYILVCSYSEMNLTIPTGESIHTKTQAV